MNNLNLRIQVFEISLLAEQLVDEKKAMEKICFLTS